MKYATVCSGVEASSLAWMPLGWTPVFFAEIEKFAAKVLAHHYPDVPNLGDMTKIDGADWRGKVDVLFGGTPCQAFSVAGLRKSLDDDRGNLTLKFAELINEIDPTFAVWENVPGALSLEDNPFGCFLAGVVGADAPLVSPYERGRWPVSGMVAGPARTAAWRVLDAQFFGVAQQRSRVFLVSGRAGDFRPAQILFEPESVCRDTPPRRPKRKEVAGTLGGGSQSRGWNNDLDRSGAFIPEIVRAVSAKWAKGTGGPAGDEAYNLIPEIADTVTASYARNGGKTGGNNCGVTNIIAVGQCNGGSVGGFGALRAKHSHTNGVPFVVLNVKAPKGKGFTLQAFNSGGMLGKGPAAFETEVTRCLDGSGGFTPNQGGNVVLENTSPQSPGVGEYAVRRLMPLECERLMGFPDGHTGISRAADTPRYRVIGNAVVPQVLAWIGRRMMGVI